MPPAPAQLLDARVRVPDHVVYRPFPTETVVLNLRRGLYHGLNDVAGRMLETLDELHSVRAASERLAAEYGCPLAELQTDLCALCDDLIARDLLVVDA
jgi:hypothetical protein